VKRSDLSIVAGIAAVVLIGAFWVLVLSPKRQHASELQDQVDQLRASVELQQQSAAAAREARSNYDTDYRKLVVLGKAVPEDSDQPSLIVQLQRLADKASVDFESIDLSSSSSATAPTPISAGSNGQVTPAPQAAGSSTASTSSSSSSSTPPSSSTSASSTPSSSTSSSSSTPSTASASTSVPATPVAPTESSAAGLPLGASVGPAGLPVMPYELSFSGGFFEIADFLKELDAMVNAHGGHVGVRGRLLTVDSFSLATDDTSTTDQAPSTGTLSASFSVTTYLTPPDQGITAGATEGGPAPATPAPATPTPASTSGSTASATQTSSPAPTP
jgi:Tfp pilus assembly protein PilO